MINSSNVFMIGWEYPPHNSGGLGVACEGITEALAAQGQRLYFTLPYQLGGSVSHMQVIACEDPSWGVDGVSTLYPPFSSYSAQMIKITDKILPVDQLSTLPQSQMEHRVEQYAEQVITAAGKVDDGFDVIHAHDWMSFPAATTLQSQTNQPFIAHVHSTEFDRIPNGMGSDYIMSTEQEGMRKADRVIAVSNYTKQLIVRQYGIDPDKIDVVYNGLAALPAVSSSNAAINMAKGRPVIVFMGRLTMQKGAEYFLHLAEEVLKKIPEALFVVAGDGDQYHSLLLKTAAQGLSAHVLFTGFLRSPYREDLLDRANVFVMPSLSEPFGLVALEAAQRKTPVIVSKNSGVAEVLPSAIQLDFWDIQKMSSSIVELVSQKKAARDQITLQNQDLSKITWQRAAQRIANSYMKAFRGHATT